MRLQIKRNREQIDRLSGWLPILCLAVLGFGQAAFAVTITTNAPGHIVTLRAGVDVDGLIQEFNLHPAFIYRRALHGFAVAMDSAASEQLKRDPRVLTVATGKAASIVTLNPETDPAALVQEFKLQPSFVYGAWQRPQWWRGNQFRGFADALDAATLATLDLDNRILAVEPDGQITLLGTQVIPAGSMPPGQTVPAGLLRMGLTNFPVAHINGQDHRINVDVAVLDGGIQLDHPDLNVYLPGSASFADGSTNGSDWHGHGTHVAGILGALDNAFGVVGVAPGVRLWSVQVVGLTQATTAILLAGLDHISQHADQISVVNASITTQVESRLCVEICG